MPMRRNEMEAMVRQAPFAYICEYDANNNPQYEAWAAVGTSASSALWIACKHTYDASNNLLNTKWAQDSNSKVGDFTVAADNLSGLTYV